MRKMIYFSSILVSNDIDLITIYVLNVHGDTLIYLLCVDDLVITKNNVNLILGLKKQLIDTFEINKLGLLHFFLGIQVLQLDDIIFLSQPKYVTCLLQRFKMEHYEPYATPFQLIGKLTKE